MLKKFLIKYPCEEPETMIEQETHKLSETEEIFTRIYYGPETVDTEIGSGLRMNQYESFYTKDGNRNRINKAERDYRIKQNPDHKVTKVIKKTYNRLLESGNTTLVTEVTCIKNGISMTLAEADIPNLDGFKYWDDIEMEL